MGKLIFISGGCRSGKSAFAVRLSEPLSDLRLYVATCPRRIDPEMDSRIERHMAERGEGWQTAEESIDICGAIRASTGKGVILVDCLTLWISNLMHRANDENKKITEDQISELCLELISECSKTEASVIFVTNETGMGIVPDNPVARQFRDLVGRCNQVVASFCDEAYFMVSGLPLKLRPAE